mgnify:FL=1
MLRKVLTSALVGAAALATVTTAAAEEMKELNFGIISTESSQNLKERFGPFLGEMEKALGVKVNAFFAPDYAGVIEGMRFDKVDVAWFGNKSAMEAVDRAGGEIFAQTIKDDGAKGYYSLLLVHKDSPIQSLDDVLKCDQSLNFGNGDPNSTSGFLVPSFYVWAQNGIDPKDCFKRVVNANHETNALAVANKRVDVATNNTESVQRLQSANPEAAAQIREIWRSPLIPSDPMVWRTNLPQEMKDKIYVFFLTFGRFGDLEKVKHEREVLGGLGDGWGPFLASSDIQLIPIRQMQLFRDKLKIESDDAMSAEQKVEKIAAIDAQLAELNEWASVVAPAPTE